MAKRQYYLVSVERVSTYRVQARSEDAAVDAYLEQDVPEIDCETMGMSAALDDDQAPAQEVHRA